MKEVGLLVYFLINFQYKFRWEEKTGIYFFKWDDKEVSFIIDWRWIKKTKKVGLLLYLLHEFNKKLCEVMNKGGKNIKSDKFKTKNKFILSHGQLVWICNQQINIVSLYKTRPTKKINTMHKFNMFKFNFAQIS